VEVPNFEKNAYDLLTFDHLSKFTPQSLENLFAIAGLQVVQKFVPETVSMQWIVKKASGCGTPQNVCDGLIAVNKAKSMLEQVLAQAQKVKGSPVAFYGQSIIAPYLVDSGLISLKDVQAMIDDNPLYHGRKWKDDIEIVGLDEFKSRFQTEAIFMTMNACYHPRVLPKLQGYTVCGIHQ
jgi:hypothetical protein